MLVRLRLLHAAAIFTLASGFFAMSAQDAPQSTPTAKSDPDALCCNTVSPEGRRLDYLIDSMHVDQFWQAHVHINWETGAQDRPATYDGPDRATHCSSFTAALGERLNIYLLRPPEHPQQLLASAQARWFHSSEGKKDGWTPIANGVEAQTLANQGELVMVVYESPDPHRPGHIAIIRPFVKTNAEIAADGPQTAQAGALNFSSGVARVSFAKHKDAWPNGVHYYAHTIDWASVPAANATTQTIAQH